MGVIKKIGVVLLLVLAASTVSHYRRELQRSRRPNVIFILLDAARADHFSCYGYGRNTTPHMDAIAREGALFLNNFSQDTATIGAVTKIFFSRYFTIKALQNDSYRWGIEQENPESLARRYDGQQAFLARVFSSYGYDTVLITDHQFFTEESYFVRQFDRHVFPRGQARSVATYGSCVSEIVSQLRDSPGKKAFIYWHVLCPHEPYRDGAERQEFLSGIDAMTVRAVKEKMRDRDTDSAEAFDSDELRCLAGLYDSNLSYIDGAIGALQRALRALGVLETTLIVITADHGENLGDHGSVSHGGLNEPWDTLVHTPLIVFYPRLVPEGTRVEGLTESVDIMPTVLELCGLRLPAGKSMDGISLAGYIRHPGRVKDYVFLRYGMRSEKYKYLLSGRLYNLRDDPQETRDIGKDAPDLLDECARIYKERMQPYLDRYNSSRRETAPGYSFYIPMPKFALSPAGIVRTCYTKDRSLAKILSETPAGTPWLLNQNVELGQLYRLPGSGPALPLTLSAALPSGSYEVYLSLGSWQEITSPLPEFGLRYRFDARTGFAYPHGLQLFGKPEKDQFFYYAALGEMTVKDGAFSLEIDFQPPDRNPYVLLHVKFVPSALKEKNGAAGGPEEREEFKRKTDELKSLGYL